MSMHGDEESDEGIVPMKRSNNGGSPLAEIVGGKGLARGNGGQATAIRTPSRGIASSRLDAVQPSGATEQRRCGFHRAAASHHHRSPEALLHRN